MAHRPLLTPAYLLTAPLPQRGWPTCESSWVALAKVSRRLAPIFDVVGSEPYWPAGAATPVARLVARKRFTSKRAICRAVIALNTRTILSIFET